MPYREGRRALPVVDSLPEKDKMPFVAAATIAGIFSGSPVLRGGGPPVSRGEAGGAVTGAVRQRL